MSLEKEHETTLTITEVGPLGYGNPDATISYEKKLASGELSPEVADRVAELLGSGDLLVDIDESVDDCIDGRTFGAERASVAGGGYVTGTAMRLGAGHKGETIDADILETGADFTAKKVYCGAHIGSHKHGDGTDCGANDKMLPILNTAMQFENEIAATTKALIETAGLEFNEDIFKRVIGNWQSVLDDANYFAESTGVSRLKTIEAIIDTAGQPQESVKDLPGNHEEISLVINYIQGKTVSHNGLARKLGESFPDIEPTKLPQAFVVDAWRIVELAKAAVPKEEFEVGVYGGVMYQAATAATLTDGSLPTYIYS